MYSGVILVLLYSYINLVKFKLEYPSKKNSCGLPKYIYSWYYIYSLVGNRLSFLLEIKSV